MKHETQTYLHKIWDFAGSCEWWVAYPSAYALGGEAGCCRLLRRLRTASHLCRN